MSTVSRTIQRAIKSVPALYLRIKAGQLRRWAAGDDRRLAFYAPFVKPGDLCFDVGANFGNRVKVFLRLGARVVAMEPLTECVRTLEMVFGHNKNLTLVPKAVGPEETVAEIRVPEVTVIASMSPTWIDAVKKSGRFQDSDWQEARKIQVTTLDKLISQHGVPSFIKIDVEGYEFEVVRGLSQPVKMISLEYTAELIEPAISSVDHLSTIAEYEYNYYSDEDLALVRADWIAPDEMKAVLRSLPKLAWGDLYARLKHSKS